MNKKGFTLIELLAVIVILAVIMVIAVPKILDLIEESRANAAISSIKLLKDSIKTQVAATQAMGTNTFTKSAEDCYEFDFDNDGNNNVEKLTVKNKEHFTGKTTYCNGVFIDDNLAFNGSSNTNTSSASVAIGTEYTYDEAKEYTFNTPQSGIYKLEVWGAQGGSNALANAVGGKGGYSKGYYQLNKNDKLYIYVGGAGNSAQGEVGSYYGGYNGGGGIIISSLESLYDKYNGTGGGATDITLVYSQVAQNSETLRYERTIESYNARIIVAGGGGGAGDLFHVGTVDGGYGGGLTGGGGRPGTQTGTENLAPYTRLAEPSKGLGGSGNAYYHYAGVVGGGAGYYGGDYSRADSNASQTIASGGGSSYIGGLTSYNGDSPITKSGNEQMPTHDGTSTMTGNAGNGYAKITLVSYN